MPRERITKSSGNIFSDLGFPPAEASALAMRSDLIAQLRLLIKRKRWTQAQAAEHLGITQSRVSDLIRGKWDNFGIDMLLMLTAQQRVSDDRMTLDSNAYCGTQLVKKSFLTKSKSRRDYSNN